MASSGINFYLDKYASFNYEAYFKIWLSFKNTGNVSVSQENADTLYSGIYHGNYPVTYDYRNISKSGTGHSYVEISPSTGLWNNQMSLVFLNKKYDSKNGILFNCLETGLMGGENVYKGFLLGYTDSSRPFFSFRGKNGLETYVTDFNLSSNHIVYFTRDQDNIIIGKYDYFTQESINNSFSIDSNYLFEPLSGYSIGWKSGNYMPSQFWNSGNSQVVDEFLLFNWPLYDYDIRMIASGWASDFIGQTTGSGIITTTGITGYLTGILSTTGITGWGITGTGYLTNEYGIGYTGYLSGQLTGTIYQTGITELTGLIQTPEYFIVPEGISYNSGFLRSFYQNYTTFLRETDELDFDSISYDTGKLDTPNYQEEGVFDDIQEKFKIFYNGEAASWVNGVAQFSGAIINSGTLYNPVYILDRDYQKTGSYINSTGFYDEFDFYWYNDISGIIHYEKNIVTSESPVLSISGQYTNNTLVFINGQKIYSGYDYYIVQYSTLFEIEFNNSNFPIITGDLCVINLNGTRAEETGNFAWKQASTGFNPNYVEVYMNGQRQIQNEDYILSDLAATLSGSGIFRVASSSLFDSFSSNDLFFI